MTKKKNLRSIMIDVNSQKPIEGKFHRWLNQKREEDNSNTLYAIVEYPDGKCDRKLLHDIQFID